MRTLSIIFTLSFSLSLFSLRDAERRERRIDTHTRPSLYVFFYAGGERVQRDQKPKKFCLFVFCTRERLYERDERRMREISSRGGMSAKNLYFIPLLLSTNHHETIKQKKFAEGARESQSPAQNARHFIPRNSFSLFISSHLTFDDDYDDDDEQQQQQRISFQSSLCIDQ